MASPVGALCLDRFRSRDERGHETRIQRGDLHEVRREQAMSTGRWSGARLDRTHEIMAGYVERGEVPGLVTLVARRGEVRADAVGAKAVGGDPMRRDTIFRISSLTKPIAAAAAMVLVEDGRLLLEEPVDRLLPELSDRRVLKRLDGPLEDTVPAKRPITLRDLLTLRMGFGFVLGPPDAYPILVAADEQRLGMGPPKPATPHEPDEWLRRFATLPLMHQPGEQWMYEMGFAVLGVLISRASEKPLETFLRERIFGPLGMEDTGFHVPAEKLDRLASLYAANPETGALELYDGVGDSQWRAGLDGRGLPRLRPDDVGRGRARRRAHPVEDLGRAHDDRLPDPRAKGDLRLRPRLPGGARLGVRLVHHTRRRGRDGHARALRVGGRPGHVLVFGPRRGHGRDPDEPAPRLPRVPQDRPRLLGLRLRGARRLR